METKGEGSELREKTSEIDNKQFSIRLWDPVFNKTDEKEVDEGGGVGLKKHSSYGQPFQTFKHAYNTTITQCKIASFLNWNLALKMFVIHPLYLKLFHTLFDTDAPLPPILFPKIWLFLRNSRSTCFPRTILIKYSFTLIVQQMFDADLFLYHFCQLNEHIFVY